MDASKLLEDAKRVPWWGWAGAGGVGLFVFYSVKRGGAAGVPAAGTRDPSSGLQIADFAGMPLDYSMYDPQGGPSTPDVPGPGSTSTPTHTGGPTGPDANPIQPTGGQPGPSPTEHTPDASKHFATVKQWPDHDSTLSGIASDYHMTYQQLFNYGSNAQHITDVAHQHGVYDDHPWDHVWPTELIEVPGQ